MDPWPAIPRFNMSPLPRRTDPKYEELLTNWFLEVAFFRDFVYRQQKSKNQRGELADGLVLFDNTALFVQSKAQAGAMEATRWAEKEIKHAVGQLEHGERMLRQRVVHEVQSETLGRVHLDPDRYSVRIGLVIVQLLDPSKAFIAEELVPDLRKRRFPVHVLALEDLMEVARRFDTAADFLFYLHERWELAREGVPINVNQEVKLAATMLERFPARLRRARPHDPVSVFEATCEAFRQKVTGELLRSASWERSLLVDDIIAHLHERDPGLPWNEGGTSADIARAIELLSYLDRKRRADLGERMLQAAQEAQDGLPRPIFRARRHNSCCYLILYSDLPRSERLEVLKAYLSIGMAHSGMKRGIGVATNSMALQGRAYDVAVRESPLEPVELEAALRVPSPFGTSAEGGQ